VLGMGTPPGLQNKVITMIRRFRHGGLHRVRPKDESFRHFTHKTLLSLIRVASTLGFSVCLPCCSVDVCNRVLFLTFVRAVGSLAATVPI
jgi:hypothetical protein